MYPSVEINPKFDILTIVHILFVHGRIFTYKINKMQVHSHFKPFYKILVSIVLFVLSKNKTSSFNLGNIYFNYVHVPQVKVSNLNHAHRLGLSDAYMSQHSTNEHIIRVITLYDKLNLEKEKIQNGVSIVFSMDNSEW